jgi:hypothetical protein
MNTHNLYSGLVILTLLAGNLIPGQVVLGSPQTPNIGETTHLAGLQIPTVSSAEADPPERTNIITATITLNPSDDLADREDSQGQTTGDISLQERYEADVETAQLNEARRLAAPVSDLSVFDQTIQITAEPDSDDDGMPDTWESNHGLNPNDPADAWADPDGDHLINLFEYQLGSDPNNASTPTVVTVSAGGNVEAAIESATTGQVIRVEGGTYNVNYKTFTPKTIMLQGGWNSGFTFRNLSANPTIFDGQSVEEVLYFSFSSGANSVILDGLTLINGHGNFGALNMIADGTSIMKWSIINSTIVNSESTASFGGASHILHWGSSESDVFIINSITANNSSSGITNQTTDTAVGRWKIINSDITHNQSTDADEGYGLDGFTLNSAILAITSRNTILWGNQKPDLNVSGFGAVTTIEAEYSDVGTVNASFGAIYTPGMGIINSDPLFTDSNNGDFTLQEGSPCVDAGTNSGAPPTDFEGHPRPADGNLDSVAITDIGADEYVFKVYLPIILR